MKLEKAAFLSRHDLTETQLDLLEKAGFAGGNMHDMDAFASTEDINSLKKTLHDMNVKMIVTVHPLLALRFSGEFFIGIFNNVNRAPLGEKPDFCTTQLVIVDQIPRMAAWEPIYNHDIKFVE